MANRTLTLGALMAAAVLATAAPALAEGNGSKVGAYEQLRIQKCSSDSSAAWTNVTDSPLDTNQRALVINVPATGDCIAAFSRHGADLDIPVENVKNLSFDFDNRASFGSGAPRISVLFSDGSVAYLSAEYCDQPMAAAYNKWSRSDFTGDTSGCGFYDSSDTEYSADGTQTAWQVFVAAHPGLSVKEAFIAVDAPGRYVLDRIAFGTNHLYNTSNTQAVNCANTESRC